MKLASHEARRLAFSLYPSSVMASVVAGALIFFALSVALLSDPLFLFPATMVGAVFGWHLILPCVGHWLAKDLDEKIPGLADAAVTWLNNAKPGELLDIGKLSAQVGARRQQDEQTAN